MSCDYLSGWTDAASRTEIDAVAKKPPPAVLDEFIDEHLPYEVQMLRATFALLEPLHVASGVAQPWSADERIFLSFGANILIESFCVHARNLIEFFKNKEACDFDPRWFTKDAYRLKKEFIGGSVLTKINEQISHLTRNRTKKTESKIDHPMREKIILALRGR